MRDDEDSLIEQRVKLVGCRWLDFASVYHLPFCDHMHYLDATENDTRTAEVLELEHRSDDAFDGPMVLLNHVVQILDLANLDECVALGVHRVQRSQIGSAFVDRHRL